MLLEDAQRKILICDRHKFRLSYYFRPVDQSRFNLVEEYIVAVGMQGYKTPAGLYVINTKVKFPDWQVPDSEWARQAGLVPGTIVEGGTPENPLKERWLGVTDPKDGVGIHGTASLYSLGARESHGCIRMDPHDVVELYEDIPKGTPIVIL